MQSSIDMSPERWKHIRTLFDRALEQSSDARAAFLDDMHNEDAEAHSHIVALLKLDASPPPLLEASVEELVTLMPQGVPPMAETKIGPYRLIKEIGRGGMGTVYLAERDDAQFQKRVAVKVVKRGMDTEEILHRFRFERQILASLEHLHIARLYDGGMSDDGRPYLVMEYVDGKAIDVFSDHHLLNVDERLALFQAVCAVVHHAHQNLVVHRDLKPSNILVDEAGMVKLLDFGIARLLAGDAGVTAPVTRTGMRVMTPQYASPEQMRGGAITTATDVYSLGIILYELLTGHRPHDAGGDLRAERALRELEPLRPSFAVTRPVVRVREDGTTEQTTPEDISASRDTTLDRLRRRLQGDLDLIVLRALQKEPERRYASAKDFSEDIKRHLAGLPVTARPDSVGYRARKFVERNLMGVASAFVFFLLIVGFATLYTISITKERDRVQSEANKLTEVRDFLVDLFKSADPNESFGESITALDLLEQGAARIEALTDQPETQAELLVTLGDVYRELGNHERARPFLERSLALRRAHLEANDPAIAESLNDLALLFYDLEEYEAAVPLVEEALSILQHVHGEEHRDVASVLNDLATLASHIGDNDESERLHRRTLDMRIKLFGSQHEDVAMTMNNLGMVYYETERYTEAESFHRQALAIRRAVLAPEHPHITYSLNNLGATLTEQGQFEEAESFFREALTLRRKVYGNAHYRVAVSLFNLGRLLRKKGELDEAETLYREMVSIDRRLLGDDHLELGFDLHNLGTLLQEKGDCAAALAVFSEVQLIFEKNLPDGHRHIAALQDRQNECLEAAGSTVNPRNP